MFSSIFASYSSSLYPIHRDMLTSPVCIKRSTRWPAVFERDLNDHYLPLCVHHLTEAGRKEDISLCMCESLGGCTAKKIWFMSSQKWNRAATFPISTFMYLWAFFIFPRAVRPIAVSFLGIFVSNFGTVSLQCVYYVYTPCSALHKTASLLKIAL